jgi:hypothetical protein
LVHTLDPAPVSACFEALVKGCDGVVKKQGLA